MFVLKKLKFNPTNKFFIDKLKNEMCFSSLIAEYLDLKKGSFYSIVPPNIDEKVVYNFQYGGYIYPFKRKEGQTHVKTENIAKNILSMFINEYTSLKNSNCLGIEDFSASPNSNYVKNANIKYLIIGERLFYLLDQNNTREEIIHYMNIAGGYIFLGLILSIGPAEIIRIKNYYYEQMSEEDITIIFNGIECLFLEAYDGESYLFWIKKTRSDLRQLLTRCIEITP